MKHWIKWLGILGLATALIACTTVQESLNDQTLNDQVTLRLNSDPDIVSKCHVEASTFRHMILLYGEASNQKLKDRAFQLAKTVPNTGKIFNEITIGPSNTHSVNDAWITTKIKSEFLNAEGLNSGDIKVVTENGTVYLMGVVPQEQADYAVNIARHVEGAKNIVKLFKITSSPLDENVGDSAFSGTA